MALDFSFTEDHDFFRQTVRGAVKRLITPRVKELDETEEFPWDLWKEFAALGYLGLRHEEKYGGMATDTISQMIFYEELVIFCKTEVKRHGWLLLSSLWQGSVRSNLVRSFESPSSELIASNYFLNNIFLTVLFQPGTTVSQKPTVNLLVVFAESGREAHHSVD